MNVEIPEDQIKSFVSEAFLRVLDDDSRDAILKDAVVSLLTPKEVGHGFHKKTVTPLYEMFESAATETCREIVREHMKGNTEFQAELRRIVVEAFTKWVKEDKSELINTIARVITEKAFDQDH